MNFGPGEMLIVLLIVLVLFGGTKLPQLAKGLGEGIRNFKQATREDDPAAERDKLPATAPPAEAPSVPPK